MYDVFINARTVYSGAEFILSLSNTRMCYYRYLYFKSARFKMFSRSKSIILFPVRCGARSENIPSFIKNNQSNSC